MGSKLTIRKRQMHMITSQNQILNFLKEKIIQIGLNQKSTKTKHGEIARIVNTNLLERKNYSKLCPQNQQMKWK